jgi:RNA recognition motif-containing protein
MGAPNTNVFIAELPAEFDDDTLSGIFGAYGTVAWCKVFDSKGGKGSGKFGIVEFGDIAEATWVVENLSGNIPEGMTTPVTLTFKRDSRSKGDGKGKDKGWSAGGGKAMTGGKDWNGGGGKAWNAGGGKSWGNAGGKASWGGKAPQVVAPGKGGAPATPGTNIHIGDLPTEVDDATLQEVFGAYGTVTWSKVFDSSKGLPTKTAIVEFADEAEAQWCVENLDGNIPQGLTTPVQVAFKRNSKGGGKSKGKGKSWGPW